MSVRSFVIPFYYGSGSATLNITGAAALANLKRYRGIYGTEFLRKGLP
jgi:hypothetical protein